MLRALFAVALALASPLASAQEALALLAQGDSLSDLGAWEEAEAAYREALGAADAETGPDSDLALEAAAALGWFLADGGAFADAEPLLARVARGREAEADTVAAGALLDVAFVRYRMGAYSGAESAAREASRRMESDETHPLATQALNQIGLVRFTLADLDRAEAIFRRALDVSERARGPVHDDVAAVLGNLAPVLQQKGDLEGARALFERAFAIDTTLYGPRSLPAATDLDRLAFLHLTQGDLGAAHRLYARALAIETEVGPVDHPRLAGTLHNLGDVLERMDRRDEAHERFESALGIARVSLGDGHPETARNLDRLAALAIRRGDLAAADSLARGSLWRFDAALGPDHPATIAARETLARAATFAGDRPLADSLLAVSLAGAERVLGPDHPDVAGLALRRAWLALRADNSPEAMTLLSRSGRILSAHTAEVYPALSAAEQVAFAEAVGAEQIALTLLAHRGAEIGDELYRHVYAWKGVVHEGLRQRAALEREALAGPPEAASAARELGRLRTELALWQGRRSQVPPEAWAAQNDSLVAARERAERSLAASGGAAADPLESVESVTALLQLGEVFVDIYRVRDALAWDGQGEAPARYIAVVTRHGNSSAVVDLGPAAALDAAAVAWVEAAASGDVADAETAALAGLAWAPLAQALAPGTERVWVSPDAALARISWAALSTEPETLVAEVASARALARLHTAPVDSGEGMLVLVGDVDYGEGRAWSPLPGTAREVERIAQIASRQRRATTLLTGSEPTPEAVMNAASGARYLHIATHGYVGADALGGLGDDARGPDVEADTTARSGTALSGMEAYQISRTPLLASGVALAGANNGARGLLPADALAGLDLTGARLVALSACDTGRGATLSGQGVLGLRAALAASGARALLLSLWPVDDTATALLMEAFYAGLWERDLAPALALRNAQKVVREAGYTEPAYWAAWVLDGEAW